MPTHHTPAPSCPSLLCAGATQPLLVMDPWVILQYLTAGKHLQHSFLLLLSEAAGSFALKQPLASGGVPAELRRALWPLRLTPPPQLSAWLACRPAPVANAGRRSAAARRQQDFRALPD